MVDTVGAMAEDTPHNSNPFTSKGNPNVKVWVWAALPLEPERVCLADCLLKTPFTTMEKTATNKVCNTCFYAFFSSSGGD